MEPYQIDSLLGAEKIGLFDSGLGGLSVLSSFIHHHSFLSSKEFIYIGDTKRCPYGDRSKSEIKEFVGQLTDWLIKEGAEAIIMACNTSAALIGDEIEQSCPVKVYNLLNPSAQYIREAGFSNIGVIATRSTARSKAFSREIRRFNPAARVTELGCPDLVPIVESGMAEHPMAKAALKPYVEELLKEGAEAIIFGCTHYPFLRKALLSNLAESTDRRVELIDPARILVQAMKAPRTRLAPSNRGKLNIATTGNAREFAAKSSLLLNIDSKSLNVRSVALGELVKPKPSAVEQMERKLKSLASSVTVETISPAPIP